ncbi:MAG TPA: hypothetical protein VMU24_02345 [Candidatus Acidoferrales bacterium]|nr:hypothetical protein [Candidatus Acidoferrales bacterium]
MQVEFSDAERDARTGEQWLSSAVSYAKHNAGAPWLKLHRAGQRFHPVRMHWLTVVSTLNDLSNEQRECACVYCQGAAFAGETGKRVPRKSPQSAHLPVARILAKGVTA